MNWEAGRQGTGYAKCKLLELAWPLSCDLYLLRYPTGSYLLGHVDPVPGKKHYRLNLVLRRAVGGVFWKRRQPKGVECDRRKWLHLFRPDKEEHGMTVVCEGTRYVLSFGFVLRDRTR